MRKFIPRLFNVLSFIAALLVFMPWANIFAYVQRFSSTLAFITPTINFLKNIEQEAVSFYALIGFGGIAVLFFLISSIDQAIKKHNKETTRPLSNATFGPLYFFGIAAALRGLYTAFTENFVPGVLNTDWFGLGKFVNMIPFFYLTKKVAFIVFGVLIGLQLLLALFCTRKLHKRNVVLRFLMLLLFALLAFVSTLGIRLSFGSNGLSYGINKYIIMYVVFGLAALLFVGYVVIASIVAHKNNVLMKAQRADNAEKTESSTNKVGSSEQFVPQVSSEVKAGLQDPLFVLPTPEDVVETVVEEKTIVKQIIFEKSDLNEVFETDYDFKNCSMVRREAVTDYFVNKQKFLTLTNNNRTMSFRLQLDKAIRLIIQYPLIGKDKYENHKIWFKIDDFTILNKEVVADIVKEAYNTVLNNQ